MLSTEDGNAGAIQPRLSGRDRDPRAYQEKAERAEQWLHRVYTEIEDRFFAAGE